MTLGAVLALPTGARVAVVGCGGKTSPLQLLARERAAAGVLIAPTTRMALSECMALPGVRTLGRAAGDKLLGLTEAEIGSACAGSALTLMEADGSKRLPLKGWRADEPVIPRFATHTLGVLSARALGLPATEAHVHRLPLFLALTGLSEGDAVDARALAQMALGAGGMMHRAVGQRILVINQADDERLQRAARQIACALARFEGPIIIGSARTREFQEWREQRWAPIS